MRKKRTYKRKRGPVVSKKVIYDGITFASGLEKYMYCALKKAGIKATYEGETFVLLNGFILKMNVGNDNQTAKGYSKTEEKKEFYL